MGQHSLVTIGNPLLLGLVVCWGAIPCGNQERGTCMMMSIGPFCWQVIDDLSLEFSGNISSLQQFLSDLTYVPFAGAQGFKGEIEWRFFVDRMPPLKR